MLMNALNLEHGGYSIFQDGYQERPQPPGNFDPGLEGLIRGIAFSTHELSGLHAYVVSWMRIRMISNK